MYIDVEKHNAFAPRKYAGTKIKTKKKNEIR